ncbi:hypothetical protein FRB99_005803 [Tulasnella sp. 403]|nr:hypothetical protein FRB99_005803 [Tulasnella sp. 403]
MASSSELLEIGKTCSHPACSLVDFLPIKCQHCAKHFCSDHFKPQTHDCPKFDASKHDRIAPECPFCHQPVAFAAGVDPNIAMEQHFDTKCKVVLGGGLVGMKSKGTSSGESPRCARAKCNKVLVAPIRCPKCSQQFCVAHRFPESHRCLTGSSSTSPSPSSSTPNLRTASTPSLSPLFSAQKNAALAAMSRAAASTMAAVNTMNTAAKSSTTAARSAGVSFTGAATPGTSKEPSSSKKPSASTPNLVNPFNKTERRSRAEEESRRKALKERAKKGLLTPSEKAKLAEEEAAAKQGGKDDCIIM